MRKPTVVIYNYNGRVQHDLITFFRNYGYETFVLTESVTCPIYVEQKNKTNACPVPCCDIMIVEEDDRQKRGVDIFNRQFQLSCKLTPRNKAIVTQSIACNDWDDIKALGIITFGDALDFKAFEAWVRDCETRIDLSQRLAVLRCENRRVCSMPVQFRVHGEDDDICGQALNVSNCGICLRISNSIKRGQDIYFKSRMPADAEEGIVQWVKELQDGWYLTGVTFCV